MPKLQKFEVAVNQQGHELSYLLGVYFGDGCVTLRRANIDGSDNRCFALQVIDEDFRDYVAEACRKSFPNSRVYSFSGHREGKGMIHALRVGLVGEWFETVTGKRTVIPNSVYQSKESTKRFLEGLMDSEGWVTDTTHLSKGYIYLQIGFSSTLDLSAEFKRMFESVGISTGKMHSRTIKSGKASKTIHLNSKDWLSSDLEFHCWRKQRKVEAHRLAREALIQAKKMSSLSFNDYKRGLIERLKVA